MNRRGKGAAVEGISCVIIAQNEEKNIAGCVKAFKWAGETVVIDGGSRDRTAALARKAGARVFYRKFDGYSRQKNFAVSKASKGWVISVDADERPEPGFEKAVRRAVENREVDGYWLPRKNFFYGRFLRFGGQYPDYQLRLFRKNKGRFAAADVHEGVVLKGRAGYLKRGFEHYTKEDIASHVDALNRYTGLEAQKRGSALFYYLLLKPFFNFIKNYIFKMGFLDGAGGFIFHVNSAMYLFITAVKKLEKKGGPGKSGR